MLHIPSDAMCMSVEPVRPGDSRKQLVEPTTRNTEQKAEARHFEAKKGGHGTRHRLFWVGCAGGLPGPKTAYSVTRPQKNGLEQTRFLKNILWCAVLSGVERLEKTPRHGTQRLTDIKFNYRNRRE